MQVDPRQLDAREAYRLMIACLVCVSVVFLFLPPGDDGGSQLLSEVDMLKAIPLGLVADKYGTAKTIVIGILATVAGLLLSATLTFSPGSARAQEVEPNANDGAHTHAVGSVDTQPNDLAWSAPKHGRNRWRR